jgi:Leucine-rich repeat (LRR) protein
MEVSAEINIKIVYRIHNFFTYTLSNHTIFHLHLLPGNQIVVLPPTIKNLTISGSEVHKLPKRDYSTAAIPLLTYMYANGLKLQDLSSVFASGNFEQLKILQLMENDFKKLNCSEFSALTVLEELHLENSQIEELNEDAFIGLDHLKTLNLNFNRITTLPEKLFHGVPQINLLLLDGNQLKEINMNRFAKNHELKSLVLRENHLFNISDVPTKSEINQLYLARNRLSTVPLHMFPKLTTLDLSENTNMIINEQTFAANRQIQVLVLFNVRLNHQEQWYWALEPLVLLHYLAIGDNRFKQIPFEKFPKLNELKHLDMTGCDLDFINVVQLKQQFPRIQEIVTDRNDLNCRSLVAMETDCRSFNITLVNEKIQQLPDKEWVMCNDEKYSLEVAQKGTLSFEVASLMWIFVLGLLVIVVFVVGVLTWRCRIVRKRRSQVQLKEMDLKKSNRCESIDSFEPNSDYDTIENQQPYLNRNEQSNGDYRSSIYGIFGK